MFLFLQGGTLKSTEPGKAMWTVQKKKQETRHNFFTEPGQAIWTLQDRPFKWVSFDLRC